MMKRVLLRFASRVRLSGACAFLILLFQVFFIARAGEPAKTSHPPSQLPVQLNNSNSHISLVAVPEPSEKALSRYRSSMVILGVRILWNLLIASLFLFTGLSARMRAWAERLGRIWYFAFALYCLAFAAVYYLANLPLAYYAGFVHPHNYGLSNQTFGKWFGNSLKSIAVLVVMVLAVGWSSFLVVKKSPGRWWLYLGLLAVPYLCAQFLIQPVVIDPLFNRFQPLQDQVLESKILALARRAGIEGDRVYEVDKSLDTKTVNAYVTGFMGTKRIVLWDTALRTLDEEELLFVMGHEMGHYVLNHLVKHIAFGSVLIFISLYAAHLLAPRIIGRFKERFGFGALSDFAALPLGILLMQLFALVGTPVPMSFSRHLEHEADRFALELTHHNHAGASAFVKMQQNNLSLPRPGIVHRFWLGTHPSIGERVDFCNNYRPWETGQPSLYDEYINP